ncbi:MAG: hypothetical protein KC462_08825 [Cyanobacteria bacterium HKST-UBA05]|nr:hypothetical protein [Cyanobacteria bacterium HKST-UBA05]
MPQPASFARSDGHGPFGIPPLGADQVQFGHQQPSHHHHPPAPQQPQQQGSLPLLSRLTSFLNPKHLMAGVKSLFYTLTHLRSPNFNSADPYNKQNAQPENKLGLMELLFLPLDAWMVTWLHGLMVPLYALAPNWTVGSKTIRSFIDGVHHSALKARQT